MASVVIVLKIISVIIPVMKTDLNYFFHHLIRIIFMVITNLSVVNPLFIITIFELIVILKTFYVILMYLCHYTLHIYL